MRTKSICCMQSVACKWRILLMFSVHEGFIDAIQRDWCLFISKWTDNFINCCCGLCDLFSFSILHRTTRSMFAHHPCEFVNVAIWNKQSTRTLSAPMERHSIICYYFECYRYKSMDLWWGYNRSRPMIGQNQKKKQAENLIKNERKKSRKKNSFCVRT